MMGGSNAVSSGGRLTHCRFPGGTRVDGSPFEVALLNPTGTESSEANADARLVDELVDALIKFGNDLVAETDPSAGLGAAGFFSVATG
jgi:hypothetical protein